MQTEEFICLGKFRVHSCGPWMWIASKGNYHHECALFGCSFSEEATSLAPAGQRTVVGEAPPHHTHAWAVWRSTEDRLDGTYIPPWLYTRSCSSCGVIEKAENLETAHG